MSERRLTCLVLLGTQEMTSLFIVMQITWIFAAHGPPSTADEAASLVRNDHESHVAMAATPKIKDAWDAVKATENLQGDIVEVGVYKGGTSMVMAYSLLTQRMDRSRRAQCGSLIPLKVFPSRDRQMTAELIRSGMPSRRKRASRSMRRSVSFTDKAIWIAMARQGGIMAHWNLCRGT